MKIRKDNLLENLDEATRTRILEMAPHTNLVDLVRVLEEEGISTSTATLSRFVRRHEEKLLVEEGKEMKGAVEELAERGKDGRLREGTLEAVRQRLYEQALSSRSPEEARELYGALVKEEAKLKELELEARKVAIAEEKLKLEALVAKAKLADRERVRAEVVESAPVIGGAEPARLEAGEVAAAPSETEKRLVEMVRVATAILNRGGDVGERLLEARAILAEGVKEFPLEVTNGEHSSRE